MNYKQIDYLHYIQSMDHKDYSFIDPPWRYEYKHKKFDKQLSYDLWDNNIRDMQFIFENLKSDYLFLWVTNSMIEDVFYALAESITDYEYRTMVTWVKLGRGQGRKVLQGMGSYFRGATEHLMVFSKENIKPLHFNIKSVFEAPIGDRTQKPKVYEALYMKHLKKIGLTKGCYIFSGPNINSFKSFDLECVDICDFEQKTFLKKK